MKHFLVRLGLLQCCGVTVKHFLVRLGLLQCYVVTVKHFLVRLGPRRPFASGHPQYIHLLSLKLVTIEVIIILIILIKLVTIGMIIILIILLSIEMVIIMIRDMDGAAEYHHSDHERDSENNLKV